MAAVSAVAALTVGTGAGLAQASETNTRPATIQTTLSAADARALLASPAITAELTAGEAQALRSVANGTATEAETLRGLGGAAKAIFNLLKKSGKTLKRAAKAAKAGYSQLRAYMQGLPWYHPARIAWIAASGETHYQLYLFLRDLAV
ncbi:hypothetical protein DNK56_20385 [Streptomyces sp. AC1-42W]|nr:hypothetical protein DNK56_20385 [Streptomyces sp. AC1-42W]PZT80258.1 hypothetical protein DNK55_12300 [Streptomyces sp. AC1-42T]